MKPRKAFKMFLELLSYGLSIGGTLYAMYAAILSIAEDKSFIGFWYGFGVAMLGLTIYEYVNPKKMQ